MRGIFTWLTGLALLSGCAQGGSLALQLVHAQFDRPFDGVTQFQLRTLNAEFEEVQRVETDAANQGDLELGSIDSGERRLEILGLGAGGAVLARGQSRPLTLEANSTARERVPFATLEVAVALPANQPITVDGDLADWDASPALVLDRRHLVAGTLAAGTDLRAELYLAWSANQLAFALVVEDDCPALRTGLAAGTCGTATAAERVLIGFDGTDDGGDLYGAGDLWLQITATSLTVLRGSVTPAQLAVVMAPRSDLGGWVLEGSIRVQALGRSTLTPADRVGFDLVLIDADPSDKDPAAVRWSGAASPPTQPTLPSQMGTMGFGS